MLIAVVQVGDSNGLVETMSGDELENCEKMDYNAQFKVMSLKL